MLNKVDHRKLRGEEVAAVSLLALVATTLSVEALPKEVSADTGSCQQLLSARIGMILERTRLDETTLSRVQGRQPLIAQWRN